MIQVLVPFAHESKIAVSYAGNDPITYVVTNGRVEVAEQHLDEFLALFDGAAIAPPEAAKPVAKEK